MAKDDTLIRKMDQWAQREHAAMMQEAKRPTSEYTGERLEKLYADMERAQRWTWPTFMQTNV